MTLVLIGKDIVLEGGFNPQNRGQTGSRDVYVAKICVSFCLCL